jgi:hypothetical protein
MGAYCLYTALSGGVKSAHRDSVTPRGLRATRSSPHGRDRLCTAGSDASIMGICEGEGYL